MWTYPVEKEGIIHRVWKTRSRGILVLLLKYNVIAINTPDGKGQTLLNRACVYGNEEEVAWLLDHGAVINWIDNDGRAPLFYAAKLGRLPVVRLLVERGACVYLIFDVNHQSPLGTCRIKPGALDKNDEIAEYISGKKASPNGRGHPPGFRVIKKEKLEDGSVRVRVRLTGDGVGQSELSIICDKRLSLFNFAAD